MKKRILSILLAVTMLAGLLPAPAFAADGEEAEEIIEEIAEETIEEEPAVAPEEPAEAPAEEESAEEELPAEDEEPFSGVVAASSGTCGSGVNWTLSDAGVLTVSGNGAVTDFGSTSDIPWFNSKDNIKTIVIQDGVTRIGKNAFMSCKNMTSLSLGSTVKSLGAAAFYNCHNLASVSLPSSLTDIENQAFLNCRALKTVKIPATLKSIGPTAFSSCPNLTFTLEAGSQSFCLENGVLYSLDKKTLVAYPGGLSATSLDIPAFVTSVADGAFYYDSHLATVVFPAGLTSIGKDAFGYSGVKTLRFTGPSLPAIGSGAFRNINAAAYYPSTWGETGPTNTYNATSLSWTAYPAGTCGGSISWSLFNGKLAIEGTGAMSDYGGGVYPPWFKGTGSTITSVVIGTGVTHIGDSSFNNCAALTSVTIPGTVTSLGNDAFGGCSSLSSLTLPTGVTSIGDSAFYGCKALTSVNIPSGVTSIGDSAFYGCEALTSVNIPSGVTVIGAGVFQNCSGLRSIEIPAGATMIAESAFAYCTNLQSIKIPDGVKTVGDFAFDHCCAMLTLEIGEGVETIGYGAFRYCTGLTDVVIPAGVTSVGAEAFGCCVDEINPTLNVRFLSASAPEIGRDAFVNDNVVITYPESWDPAPSGKYGASSMTWQEAVVPEIRIPQDYIAMAVGDSPFTLIPEVRNAKDAVISWNVVNAEGENDGSVIKVSTNGDKNRSCTVSVAGPGTAWAVAVMTVYGEEYSARCRIDVAEKSVYDAIDGETAELKSVSLPEPKATVELFKTSYTQIPVVMDFTQNMTVQGAGVPADTGHAVTSARFDDNTDAAKYFDLRVVDDRTLEIIPNQTAIDAGVNAPKTVAGTYRSAITLTVDGKDVTTGQMLTLTVKKTQPAVKITAGKMNSYKPGLAARLTVPAGVTIREFKTPDWMYLTLEPGNEKLYYNGELRKSASGKLELTCAVEGWAIPKKVTVSVSASSVAPKLTFKPATVTLTPGTSDSAVVAYTISPAEYAGVKPVFDRVMEGREEYGGKTLTFTQKGGNITVSAAVRDDKAHTYKVFYRLEDKEFSFTVKTRAVTAAPAVTVKASGAVDLNIEKSPATVTLSLKNYNGTSSVSWSVTAIRRVKKGLPEETVTGLFNVPHIKDGKFVLTAKKPDELATGYTYYVDVEADIGTGTPVKGTGTFAVKATAKPAVSVTVKAKGSIDTLRPSTSVTLTPTWKNYYLYNAGPEQISVSYKVKGKGEPIACSGWFNVAVKDGAFVIRLTDEGRAKADTTDKFTATFTYDINGTAYTKSLALSVKQGAVSRAKALPASVTLLKKDRYSTGAFTIDTGDAALTGIDVEKTLANSVVPEALKLEYLDGQFVVRWKDSRFPLKTAASYSVKVNLYLYGNNTAKANKALTVKVITK